jgi:hypothetical protein
MLLDGATFIVKIRRIGGRKSPHGSDRSEARNRAYLQPPRDLECLTRFGYVIFIYRPLPRSLVRELV